MEILLHHALAGGTPELILLLLSFGLGFSKNFKTPFMVAIFMVKLMKWWLESHPHGKVVAEKTDANEELHKWFGIDLKKYDEMHTKTEDHIDTTDNPSL